MAEGDFRWSRDPADDARKFKAFARNLPFKLSGEIKAALELGEHSMRDTITGLDRILTYAMIDSVDSRIISANQYAVSGEFGFLETPFYTKFQEYGTRRGITAMNSFLPATIIVEQALQTRLGDTIWDDLR